MGCLLFSLTCFSCFASSQTTRKPALSHKAAKVPVVSSVPSGCTLGPPVSGWARAAESDRQVWDYALHDMRNQASQHGAGAVMYRTYRLYGGYPYRTVQVYGQMLNCRVSPQLSPERQTAYSEIDAQEESVEVTIPPPASYTEEPAYSPPVSPERTRPQWQTTPAPSPQPTRERTTQTRSSTTTEKKETQTFARGGGRCYSDRDCPGGVCRSGKCTTAGGRCYSDRECGSGVCRSGVCTSAGGRCYSDRECPGGVCRSGKCTTAGGRCYSDRECGGGVCRSGVCTTAGGRCYSDRECPGGVCRSGKCTTAGGRCYSDRECGGGVCRSGKCS